MRGIAIAVIVLIMSTCIPVHANDNVGSRIYTDVDGYRYYLEDGSKLFRVKDGKTNNEFLFDFSVYEWSTLDIKMAKNFCATDIASTKWDGHTLIYVIGVAFDVNEVDFDDTASYKNMKVKIGTPYTVMFTYIVDKDLTVYPYNKNKIPIHFEGKLEMPDIWDTPYKSEFSEANEEYTFLVNYNFMDKVVYPKIIASEYRDNLMYLITETKRTEGVLKNGGYATRHVELFHLRTERDSSILGDNQNKKWSMNYFYAGFSLFEKVAKENIPEHKIDQRWFIIKEEDKWKMAVYNFNLDEQMNKKTGVACIINFKERTRPKLEDTFWRVFD